MVVAPDTDAGEDLIKQANRENHRRGKRGRQETIHHHSGVLRFGECGQLVRQPAEP